MLPVDQAISCRSRLYIDNTTLLHFINNTISGLKIDLDGNIIRYIPLWDRPR